MDNHSGIHIWMTLALAVLLSGCARLEAEKILKGECVGYPPSRIYMGTAKDLNSINILSHSELPLSKVAIMLPFDFIADTVMLPYDLLLTVIYYADKPLNELVLQNDIAALKRRLEKGEDPDCIDFRFKDFSFLHAARRYPAPPLMHAFQSNNFKAFSTLMDHGAAAPMEFFNSIEINDLRYLKLVLSKGLPHEVTESFAAQYIVSEMIKLYLHRSDSSRDVDDLHSAVKLLLENGFPPNGQKQLQRCFDRGKLYYKWMENPIDCIQRSQKLSAEEKARFIQLLRSHGARSGQELDSGHQIMLPPETPFDEIPEMFKPVAKIFANKPGSRFSSSYCGVDSPVLVIDYGSKNGSGNGFTYRESISVHHRESPTRWSQKGEPFDVPVAFRVVLTPKGVSVPSRIHGDMPARDIILEEWLTLTTCEAYIERAVATAYFTTALGEIAHLCETDCESKRRLNALHYNLYQKPVIGPPHRHSQQWNTMGDGVIEHHPLSNFLKADSFIGSQHYRHAYSPAVNDKKAEFLLKAAGIRGRWHGTNYSSHRNLKYLSAASDHRVPYPDEFLVIVASEPSEHIEANGEGIDYRAAHNGQYYWNCRAYKFKDAFIYVFYGDEANPEEFGKVVEIAKKVFVK